MKKMDVSQARRMAAEVLKVGVYRVRIDPDALDLVAQASTKEDIRRLIKEGYIGKRPVKGTSTARAKIIKMQKKKGRRRGPGSRKGKQTARAGGKEPRVKTIRAIRRLLRELRDEGRIDRKTYRMLYRKAKGGYFRSKRHVLLYIKEHGLFVEREV